ncbi:MAG: signal peptidase I [Candidatus Moranbacteria bacterium]|nr:signal peptidase I [Candidatus Moranbacteria bacterium]
MKRFFSVLVNIVFAGFMVLALSVVLSMFSVGGVRLFSVLSGSMEPTIHTGSAIFDLPSGSYEVGDIVTRATATSGVTVTHRIIEKIEQDGQTVFRTKGDANNVADQEAIPVSSIVGKVAFSVPWFGYVIGFAQTKEGFILVVIVPAVIIIYEELRKMRKEIGLMWSRRKEKKVAAVVGISERPIADNRPDVLLPVVKDNIGSISFVKPESQEKRRIV